MTRMTKAAFSAIITDEMNNLAHVLKTNPTVRIDNNPRVTRRRASTWYRPAKIVFYIATMSDMPEVGIRDTVRHEVAHLLAYELYGEDGKGHGTRWRQCAIKLGAYPRATSSAEQKVAHATTGAIPKRAPRNPLAKYGMEIVE